MTPKNHDRKLEIAKLSDDDLQDRFTEVFEKRVGVYNHIESFECICKRDTGSKDVHMEVTIVGMAGSPVLQDYKNMKVKNSDSIILDYDERGSIAFKFMPEKTVSLNSNEYVVVYRAV